MKMIDSIDLKVLNETALKSHLLNRQKLSLGTFITRKSRIKIFLAWLSGKEITPNIVDDFFTHLRGRGLTNTSLNTYRAALFSLQSYLSDQGHPGFMENYKSPFTEEEPNKIPLTADEIRLLRNACLKPARKPLHQTMQDITLFHTDTGCRWEDAQKFRMKFVDIAAHEISYIQLKTGKRIVKHITEPLFSILLRRIRGKEQDELVFENTVGGVIHYPDYHKFLKTLAKTCGITKPTSPHILRHSYGQNSYDVTGNIYLTQDLLGHKSIRSTMRYAKNSTERIKEAQQTHPHLDLPPYMLVELIEKLLENTNLQKNKKFNTLKVRLATVKYVAELYDSILLMPGIGNRTT